MSKRRRIIAWVLVGVVVLFVAYQVLQPGTERTRLSLDEFESQLDEGGVRKATLLDQDHTIEGTLRGGEQFEVSYPGGYTARITQQVVDADIDSFDVDTQEESAWVGILFNLLPFVLVIGVILLVLHQTQGGGGKMMGFGKARAKGVVKDQPEVTFADVAGLDEAVEELQEIKEFLESPAKFRELGAKIPRGVLLFGPPGTGKTLLAARSRAKPACRSSRSADRTSSRCSWVSARPACAISSSRRRRPRRPSCSSTRSTRSAATAAPASAVATTSGSRRSTSSSSRWTASTSARA